jgi:hypothetical protein
MAIASSAFATSITSKPASTIISAAFIRSRNSSSTTRTTGLLVADAAISESLPTLSKRVGKDSFRGEENAADRTRALCHIHDPAGVPRAVDAHHVPDHLFAESASRIVISQRHAPDRFAVVTGGVVNGKTVDQHRLVLGPAAGFARSILLTQADFPDLLGQRSMRLVIRRQHQ